MRTPPSTPIISAMRSTYNHSDLLRTTSSAQASLSYAHQIALDATIGLRTVAGTSQTRGEPELHRYATYATVEKRLTSLLRISFDLGVEHLPHTHDVGPDLRVRAAMTRPAGAIRLCQQGARLDVCLKGELGSQVSAIDGFQRTKSVGTDLSYRLDERKTLILQIDYQRIAEPTRVGMQGDLQAASALAKMNWQFARRASASGEIGYIRRQSEATGRLNSAYVGVHLRIEPALR